MTEPAPSFQPSRLVRWALLLPASIVAWVSSQLLIGRLFFDGPLAGGLTWVEGIGEAVFILVAAVMAPSRKRAVATVAFAFYVIRNTLVVMVNPSAGTPAAAALTIMLAGSAAALVWWRTQG